MNGSRTSQPPRLTPTNVLALSESAKGSATVGHLQARAMSVVSSSRREMRILSFVSLLSAVRGVLI